MKKKPVKKILSALEKSGFDVKSAKQLTAAEEKIFEAREKELSELNKPLKTPPPSYFKRKAEAKARKQKRIAVPPSLKKYITKFGAPGEKNTHRRGGYYAGRAAQALIKLGAQPRKISQGTEKIKSRIAVTPLKGGWYALTINEKTKFKKYRWAQVKRLQQKENRDLKLQAIANKIGTSVTDLKKILRTIEAQEKTKVRKFKKTKKYKSLKHKRGINAKRRMSAIFGAMTDLLQIYGSPAALRNNPESAQWKNFKGHGWALKTDGHWMKKTGPDSWQQLRIRRRKK